MTNDHEGYYHDYCVHHPGQKANMAKTSTAAGRHDLKLSQAASQWRIGKWSSLFSSVYNKTLTKKLQNLGDSGFPENKSLKGGV